jgi:protein involved in polysaccharide export with SLBB domain
VIKSRFFLLCGLVLLVARPSAAQLTSGELYQQFQNKIGVLDSTTEKLLAQRQAIRAGYDVQALEAPVDPKSYVLGPGDGVYLNVFALHYLDQDLTVTPEGRLLLPRVGQVQVAGLNVIEAEKRVNELLAQDYKSPNASLSLRKLRPIKISILGEVLVPGVQSATALQRVSEVIDKSGGFKRTSSLRNIEVRSPTGEMRARADLFKYYAIGDLDANPMLQSGDVIYVPAATRFVTVNGSVVSGGRIEYVPGEDLNTLLKLSHGFLPSALPDTIELARYSTTDPNRADLQSIPFAQSSSMVLQDGDQIFVKGRTEYHQPHLASVSGEVRFPGRMNIIPGQTRLKDAIDQAGGILPAGSLDEAVVIRRSGNGDWEADLELQRLQSVSMVRKEGMTDEEYTYYLARMRQYNRSVMVVDFRALMQRNDQSQNILLREEDSIYVPRARGFVTVSGSVNSQGNVGFIDGGTYEDYVAKAGGYTSTADRAAIRVVNGKTGSYIDPRSESAYRISAGDMIIVPQERSEFWKNLGIVTATTAQILTIVAGIFLLVKR